MAIDLSRVRSVLTEVDALVTELDGVGGSDDKSWAAQPGGDKRREQAKRSQELQLLATRLELAASLVRVEFWHYKGEVDPLNRRR